MCSGVTLFGFGLTDASEAYHRPEVTRDLESDQVKSQRNHYDLKPQFCGGVQKLSQRDVKNNSLHKRLVVSPARG